MRWIVGDVHGCARELEDLLRHVGFSSGTDELWCTGDLVNTGPDSLATLRLWRDAGGRTVLGNHDIYALLAHAGSAPRRKDRLDELFAADDAESLLGGLRASPVVQAFEGVRLVHAGVHPRWTDLDVVASRLGAQPHDDDWLRSDDVAFLTRVRCCDAFGQRARFTGRPEDAPPPFKPWDDFYAGDPLIVHGHWAMRGFYRTERTLGLDSACVYGGRLTAWCPEDDRIASVPCRSARGYLV